MGLSFNALDHLKEEKMFHYVAKLACGAEYFFDVEYAQDTQTIAANVVKLANITTNSLDPKFCTIEVFELKIKQGKIERSPRGGVNVSPPFRPITPTEYQVEITRLFNLVPVEFHTHISKISDWHQKVANYEDRIAIIDTIIKNLIPAVEQFNKTVNANWRELSRAEVMNVSQT